jgi:hypothetical protein
MSVLIELWEVPAGPREGLAAADSAVNAAFRRADRTDARFGGSALNLRGILMIAAR